MRWWYFIGCLWAVTPLGCADQVRDLALDESAGNPESDAIRRLRDRQNLTYILGSVEQELGPLLDPPTAGAPFGTIHTDMSTLDIVELVRNECEYREWLIRKMGIGTFTLPQPACNDDTLYSMPVDDAAHACSVYACYTSRLTCEANLLNELSSATAPITFWPWLPEAQRVTVPPQSRATRAALREVAYLHVKSGATRPPETHFNGSTADCMGLVAGSATTTVLESVYVGTRELYELAVESAMQAYRDYLALADGEYGRRAGLGDAAPSAEAIRIHAARLLVSGEWAWHYVTSTDRRASFSEAGFCTQPELSPTAATALRLIRQSGLSPQNVDPATGPTTLTFVDLLEDNIRNIRYPTEPQPAGLSAEEFLDSEALVEADIIEARSYLGEEMTAFARDRNALIPDLSIPISNGSVYAATRRPPTAPSALYYASVARDLGINPTITTGTSLETLRQFAASDPSLVASAGRIRAIADWWNRTVQPTISDMDFKNAITDISTRLMMAPEHETSGRVFVGNRSGTSMHAFDVFVLSQHVPADIVPLTSLKALSCATSGEHEGTRCSWTTDVVPSSLTPFGSVTHWENADMTDFLNQVPSTYLANKAAFVATTVPAADRLYIVVKRPGATANVPGSYEPLGTVWIHSHSGGGFYFSELSPELDALVGAGLTPSTDWCTHPVVGCPNMFALDSRLPLEDEITETVSPSDFENSWSRYLTNARAAADRTDALGKETLDLAFSIAERSEAALSDLEDICGEVSLSPFDGFDPTQDVMAHLATEAAEPTPSPAARTLLSCLSDGATAPYVTIGSAPLCLWYRGDPADNRLCEWEGATQMPPTEPPYPCPRIRRHEDAAGCRVPNAMTYTPVEISGPEAVLSLVQTPEDAGRTDPRARDCVHLRELRRVTRPGFTATADAWQVAWQRIFRDTSVFDANSLQQLAPRLRWQGGVGSHSTIFLNDRPVIRTGSLLGGTLSTGLCGGSGGDPTWRATIASGGYQCVASGMADPPFPAAEDHESLFCTHVDCSNPATRAELNARLLRAAVVARWLGQEYLGGFRLPHSPTECPTMPTVTNFHNYLTETFGRAQGDDAKTEFFCNAGGATFPLWSPSLPAGNSSVSCNPVCGSNGVAFHWVEAGRWGSSSYDFFDRSDPARLLSSLRIPPSGDANPLRALHDGRTLVSGALELPWAFADYYDTESPSFGVSSYFEGHRLTTSGGGGPAAEESGRRLSHSEIFDALELLCEAGRAHQGGFSADVGTLSGPEQLDLVAARIQQEADRVREWQSLNVLRNVPDSVIERLRGRQAAGLPIGGAGRMGGQVQRLHGALLQLEGIAEDFSLQLTGVSQDIRRASTEIRRSDLSNRLDQIGYTRQTYDSLNRCVVAVAAITGTIGLAKPIPIATFGAAAAAVSTCATAAADVASLAQQAQLREEITGTDRELIMIEVQTALTDRTGTMTELARLVNIQVSEVNAALIELDLLRAQGRRALARALFLDHSDTGATFATNTILRRRLALVHSQYESSRQNAIWTAFMAKRAIEQRFGVRLASMNEEMSLVEAPATWESTLCEFEGINYRTFQDPSVPDADLTTAANAFIGEYVTKLENFVESYRLDYPFINGEDTSVVSLRDDVMRVREPCTRPSSNAVRYPSNLLASTTTAAAPAWRRYGCLADGSGAEYPNCIAVELLDDAGSQIGVTSEAGPVVPHRVVFGPPDSRCPGASCPCAGGATACGWTASATYGQDVALAAGLHRLSWYANVEGNPSAAFLPAYGGVSVRGASSLTEWAATSTTYGSERVGTTDWYRYWTVFEVPYAEAGGVHIRQQNAVPSLRVAGIMLERIESLSRLLPSPIVYTDPLVEPGAFIDTDGNGAMRVLDCEDADGGLFRSRGFQRGCLQLCPDGLQASCPEERSTEYCFWETDFSISQRAIDRGLVFAGSGFARGNFNYRTESLAVNIVGSAARVCADERLPSTCYNAGFVAFSLEHLGPYPVRNYRGQEYNAPLFPGVIEHARAVALERYVTNPISSADRALIDPYVQRQFRGRPLAGNYRLRIWDEPGVNFDGIEDIQLVLNYRYWTRTR